MTFSQTSAIPPHLARLAITLNDITTSTVPPGYTFLAKCFDGDCFLISGHGRLEFIRLAAIDAPESNQTHGPDATEWLRQSLTNKPLTIQTLGKDRHGRTIAFVSTPDIPCISLAIVQAGWAWFYTQFGHGRTDIKTAETQARSQRLGLWQNPHPIPPWKFRQTNYPHNHQQTP